jgi:hypothetical protein
MQPINERLLPEILGGGDPIKQPLTMPPGWTPTPPGLPAGLPGWITSMADYLKYLGVHPAQ